IRDDLVTGVQTCALPIFGERAGLRFRSKERAPFGERRHRTEHLRTADVGEQPQLDRIESSTDELGGALRALERARHDERVRRIADRKGTRLNSSHQIISY